MAFTRVRGSGITTTDNYIVGVITATKFVGESGGSATFDNVSIGGSLTVNGDFTTLNTTLREVELLQVDANSSTAAGIITQRGSGDILNLYDGSTKVFTAADGGNFGFGTSTIRERIHLHTSNSDEAYLRFTNSTTGTGADDGFNIGIDSAEKALIWNKENTDMLFGTNGETRMTISSDGSQCTIRSDVHDGGLELLAGNNNQESRFKIQGKAANGTEHNWFIGASRSADRFYVSDTTGSHFAILDGGNIGIGEVNPEELLHISSAGISTVRLTDTRTSISDGTRYGVIQFEQRDSNTPGVSAEVAAVMQDTTNGNTAIQFRTGTPSTIDERVRITGGGNLKLPDNGKIELGGAQTGAGDFSIYHDGSHAYVDTGTGLFYSDATAHIIRNKAGNQDVAKFNEGATGCMLYCSNGVKLTTTTTGITVTGEVASTQDYPTQQAALDFNFAVTKRLDPRIRFTRVGAGSYIDENGVIKIAGSNEPRFDHDFVTGECKGLLMEEARTNMATWSNFRTLGPTANVIIGRAEGPDGVADSALAVTYTKSSASYVRTGNYAVGQNTAYTFSIWLKKVAGSPGNSFHSYTTGGAGSTIFNSTGFQNTEGQDLSNMPTGVWKKFEMTKTTISGATAIDFVLPGYDQVNCTFHYYGIQLESGSCATSYIPCHYGAATSRNADRAWIDGEDFTDVYNTTEGTFICRTSTDDITVSNQWAWGVEKSTNRGGFFNGVGYRVGGGGSGYAGGWYNNNGNTSAFVNMNASITKGTPFTVGFAYKLNDMAGSTNGSTPSSDTSATIAADGEFDRFSLGSYHYDDFERGHIQRVMYYPKRVTNNQLQLLTS